MIVITGAAGFIGSCLVSQLNQAGERDLIIVDDFSRVAHNKNLIGKRYKLQIERIHFIKWFDAHASLISFVYHIGARTDTTERDIELLDRLNLNYTKAIWKICTTHQIPLVYASSAATYGLGELGYKDSHDLPKQLEPLNDYGHSKNNFDIWALQQETTPPFWAGLKFFNVYGPNEYHKGRMASVIFHTVNQIRKTGGMKLFRSHRADVANGQQSRDFIYIKDLLNICLFLKNQQPPNGLYNVGTGQARTFWDLAANTFKAMELTPNISFIDTPIDIRDKYQYFTEADMTKLKNVGYDIPFYTLEEGIKDYVQQYLLKENYF